jgi:hypothetical protein
MPLVNEKQVSYSSLLSIKENDDGEYVWTIDSNSDDRESKESFDTSLFNRHAVQYE